MSIATVVETAVRRHVQARVVSAAASLGVDRNRIAPEVSLEELGLDSLDVAEFVQILEFEFDLNLFARAHGRVHTVGDAIDLVVSELS